MLDLQFQKGMLIASSAVVIAFTYIIGIIVGLIANQIDIRQNALLTFAFSVMFLAPCMYFFLRSRKQMNLILLILKDMQLKG